MTLGSHLSATNCRNTYALKDGVSHVEFSGTAPITVWLRSCGLAISRKRLRANGVHNSGLGSTSGADLTLGLLILRGVRAIDGSRRPDLPTRLISLC